MHPRLLSLKSPQFLSVWIFSFLFLNIIIVRSSLSFGMSLGMLWGMLRPSVSEPFAKPLPAAGAGTVQLWSSTPRVQEERVAGLKAGDSSRKGAKFCVKSWCHRSAGSMCLLLDQAGQLMSLHYLPLPEAETIAFIPNHIA